MVFGEELVPTPHKLIPDFKIRHLLYLRLGQHSTLNTGLGPNCMRRLGTRSVVLHYLLGGG